MYLVRNEGYLLLSLDLPYRTTKMESKKKYWRNKDPKREIKIDLDTSVGEELGMLLSGLKEDEIAKVRIEIHDVVGCG